MAPYRRIPVSPNEAKFRQLSPFIPACPTSSNFPHWAIKISYDSNSMLSNAIDPNSEDEVITSQNISKSMTRIEHDTVISLAGNNNI